MSGERDTAPGLSSAYDDLLDEHEQLRDLLLQLAGLTDYLKLFPLLEQLDALVAGHFEREEAEGGFYRALESGGEAFAESLRILKNEHYLIRSVLEGLLARARFVGEDRLASLLGDIARMAEILRHHEAQEARLAQQIYGS